MWFSGILLDQIKNKNIPKLIYGKSLFVYILQNLPDADVVEVELEDIYEIYYYGN